MNAVERQKKIEDYVNVHNEADFSHIRNLFPDVSEMTIRRDMEFLSKNNRIIRVLGGAKSVSYLVRSSEDAFMQRSTSHEAEKQLIARKALQLIEPGSTIFLGSGSTANELARIFPNGNYTIVTTGMNCAIELSSLSMASVLMLGGAVNKNSFCVNGSLATSMLETMSFDLAFLGVSGYAPGHGFCTSVVEDYVLRQRIISQSDTTAILMDSSKVGRKSIYTFAGTGDVEYVISDENLDPETITELTTAGITVL